MSVTVAICTHNGGRRLPDTLAHLARQVVPEGVPWEVLIVDNASTDDTQEVARRSWPFPPPAPMTVVSEPEIGLSNARRRAFDSARYDLVSFVDDDNWVEANWANLVVDVMAEHPDVAACGGQGEPLSDGDLPSWFSRHAVCYAVGPQAEKCGDITDSRGHLYGAGLTVRKSAWQQLVAWGFTFKLDDRRGRQPSCGGDTELCLALRLAGWRLWYEPRLRFRHYLPQQRLTWEYLRSLHRGFGAASVSIDAYTRLMDGSYRRRSPMRSSWQWQALLSLHMLIYYRSAWAGIFGKALEGNDEILRIEAVLGRTRELLRQRETYNESLALTRNVAWVLHPHQHQVTSSEGATTRENKGVASESRLKETAR